MKYLNYPGDARHIVGEIKGRDMHGAFYRAETADLTTRPDGTTGTRVGFRPLTSDELTTALTNTEGPAR